MCQRGMVVTKEASTRIVKYSGTLNVDIQDSESYAHTSTCIVGASGVRRVAHAHFVLLLRRTRPPQPCHDLRQSEARTAARKHSPQRLPACRWIPHEAHVKHAWIHTAVACHRFMCARGLCPPVITHILTTSHLSAFAKNIYAPSPVSQRLSSPARFPTTGQLPHKFRVLAVLNLMPLLPISFHYPQNTRTPVQNPMGIPQTEPAPRATRIQQCNKLESATVLGQNRVV
ncbi:hypothetical protein BOTBODRAFT_487542 [Botryobasidium botryosum FD-172 SS1]|uniref:Uncharacterized protein n=1 Tax=Botryobasidium botryosum (strain FD-172 SS1) TaxID=930990 RepID=A0A067MFK4_BOTB1|nr:hypothetical protein BOTBODRAFT_487542 [Botryobasidium botryosum FD-172 SS1]